MRASRLPGSDQASSFEPVFRRRSFEAIERAARRRVTLIVAPAGYGKSVAIGQYLARSAVPFVRFVARPGNATLLGFTRGLAQSFSAHAPGLGRGWFRAYQAAASAPDLPDALAAWFVANLGPGALTVVLDDLHVVADDSGAVQFLRSFIARSSNLAWILSSRDAITLPYATWLAYGQADEPIEADVLRIHPDEAAGIVRACNVVLDSERVAELLALVDGWPAAFMFALRAAAGSSDAAQVLACSRESLYTYLADQVFTAFSRREQRFLLDTALLPAVDLDVLAAADWESPREVYADLRRHAHFIVAESATVFRYHDLFREFLVHRLRSQGSIAFYRAQLASADLSEAADWTGAALRLRTEAGDEVGITRMLRVESARRFLAVGLEEVDGALAALPESQLRSDAALLGLFALVRAFRAQWDQSDAAYRTAIALATDADERAVLSLKFGMSLYQRTLRDAALEVLSAIDLERVTAKTRARVLSHLAVHHAQNGETDAADRCAAQALGIMAAADAPARAAALYNIAMASFCLQRPAEGRHRLTEALAIAERGGEAERDIVIRCHHALSFLAFNDGCWDEVRGHLTTMLVNAELSGEVAQVELATGELFRFETLVGDHARLGEFAPRHHLEHPGVGSNVSRTFARSMHAALAGDFENAELRLREELRCEALDVDDRVFVLSHEALWAAAAGNGEAARATLDRAGTAFVEFAAIGGETGPYATQMLMAKVILAIAHTLLAQPCECARLLAEVEQIDSPVPAVRQFAAAARLFNRLAQRAAQRDEVDGAAAKLHALGLGGYADLFAVLPPVNPFGAFARLTKTQMRMVRLIARGGTTHAIAAEIGRSPETVGSHIAAILSKLGCERRSEAVALARKHGIE